MYTPYYKSGDANAICDICGFKYKLSELKRNWKNQLVCPQDWESRNELDFLKIPAEKNNLENPRVEQADIEVITNYIIAAESGYCSTNCATAGLAIAGCAIAGKAFIGGL